MEERLEELMATGRDREEAIHVAMDEFGDAAGLADQFSRIVRQRIRRRIMPTSLGTIAAAAAIILVVTYRMPQDRTGVPGLTNTLATQKTEEAQSQIPVITPDYRDPAAQHLAKRLDVDYEANRLVNTLAHLRNETGANFFINWPA